MQDTNVTTLTIVTEASTVAIWTMVVVAAAFRHIRIKTPTFTHYFLTAGKMVPAIFSPVNSSSSPSRYNSLTSSLSLRLYWAATTLLQAPLEAPQPLVQRAPLDPIRGPLAMRMLSYSCKIFWLWVLVPKLVNLNSRTLEATRIWAYQVKLLISPPLKGIAVPADLRISHAFWQ